MLPISEDRILDFLDGRLTNESEEELLHTLAVSPERRQMLREHLRLRELTNTLSKEQRFTVPEYVTGSLFNKLTALGYTAPVSTAEILNHAPDLVRASRSVIQEKERDYTVGGWMQWARPTFVTACLVSFLLGVGAFYVFGEKLGVPTLSEQHQSVHANATFAERVTPARHEQFSSVLVNMPELSAPGAIVRSGSITPSRTIGLFPARLETHLGEVSEAAMGSLQSAPSEEPGITYTAPKNESRYTPSFEKVSHSPLRVGAVSWFDDNFSPLLDEKGTISARFGAGRAPGNTTRQWTSLSELKFTWHLNDWILGRASLGQLMSYERHAENPELGVSRQWEITTPASLHVIPVAGVELGLTLDPLNIPVEISAGFMADGTLGTLYKRAGIMGHMDLFDALTIGVGIQGMLYTHDIRTGVDEKLRVFKDFRPTVDPNAPSSEKAGFLGPSLEIGWHF